jgi:hypothetical protein
MSSAAKKDAFSFEPCRPHRRQKTCRDTVIKFNAKEHVTKGKELQDLTLLTFTVHATAVFSFSARQSRSDCQFKDSSRTVTSTSFHSLLTRPMNSKTPD